MFPFLLRLLLLASARASARLLQSRNESRLRTFVRFPDTSPDDLINPCDIIGDDLDHNCSTSFQNRTPEISEEALQFLTGPVSTILIPSFYTVVCSLSVPINVFALLAFARGIHPKKPAAIYMLNLAVADLLFGLMLPFKISYHFEGNDWRFGSLMCRVVTAAFYWNTYCSVLLIACIGVDRLLAVVYPIQSLSWRTSGNSVKACVAMWMLSLAGSVPLVMSDQTVRLRDLNITTCHDVQDWSNVHWLKIHFAVLCCVMFFLPLLVTMVSYTRVIWTLSNIVKQLPGTPRKRRRAVVMALTVLVIFVLCFMPTNCLLLSHYLMFDKTTGKTRDTPDGSYGLYLVFLCLGSLNCLLDPLVYYFGSSQCQKQLSNVLSCRKLSESSSITMSSSDSCRSSTRPMLKSSRTESSQTNFSDTKVDSSQEELSSLYKKMLV